MPTGTPGFTVQPGYSKVGWCASDTHELSFDDVRVPAANLLGERGRGYAQFLRILDEGRVAFAALGVGLAQGCVDESVAYAKQRQAFGKAIGEYQAIQFKLADMEARAHTARLAYYDAASRLVNGRDVQAAGGHREAAGQRCRGEQCPGGDPGARRLRLHERDPRSPACGATRRSSRSVKAPRRSSA